MAFIVIDEKGDMLTLDILVRKESLTQQESTFVKACRFDVLETRMLSNREMERLKEIQDRLGPAEIELR